MQTICEAKENMSLIYKYLILVFISINLLSINCQSFQRYGYSMNDCLDLCYGREICIYRCKQSFNRNPNFERHFRGSDAGVRNFAAFDDSLESQNQMNYEISDNSNNFITPSHCGLRDVTPVEREGLGGSGLQRIVGGEDAEPNEFPWLVSLQLKRAGKPTKHFCGAAIINRNYILTAAHCTDNLRGKESEVIIKAGITDLNDKAQILIPEKFIVHTGWDVKRQLNDISIIKLKTRIKYIKNNYNEYTVNAICLPTNRNEPKTSAQLAGWGQLGQYEASSDWLQKITMPIWNRRSCAYNYQSYLQIRSTHICAGGLGGQDSCMGDSGGPLMQTKGSRTTLIGVVSFGIPCALEGLPGVYTNIMDYMDWINNVINY